MIEVTIDAARRLVIARMADMLTVADVEAFSQVEQVAVQCMGWKTGEFDLLVIAEGNLVQTQDVMNAFANLLRHSPLKSRKFATVRDGVLTRMQGRRMAKLHPTAEVFESLAEADAWLATDGQGAAAELTTVSHA